MKTIPSPPLALCLAFLLVLPTAFAGTAESNILTVDTRGTATSTSISVSGRVLSQKTKSPLLGATVTLAGSSTQSNASGVFLLGNVDLGGGSTLQASLSGYLSQSQTVTAGTGSRSVSLPDVLLSSVADAGSKPVVEWVKPDLTGLFLYGWSTNTTLRIRVNWNGNSPGQVMVYGNNQLRATLTGAGPEYATTMPVDSWFVASGLPGVNAVRVVARTAGTIPMEGENRFDIAVLPVPAAFAAFYAPGYQTVENNILKLRVTFPAPAIKKTVSLTLIGTFGAELQGEGELSYNIRTGGWELKLGGTGSSAKVLIGNYTGEAGISATGSGSATLASGLTFDSLTLAPSLALTGEFRLGAWGLPDLLGPGLSMTLTQEERVSSRNMDRIWQRLTLHQKPDTYLAKQPSLRTTIMADNRQSDDALFDLENEPNSSEELQDQVQKAQEQLLQLRRQQESIEKQKKELEELNRRQNEFEEGKAEMTEKMNRAVVVLERAIHESQKRTEQLTATRVSFLQHLDLLDSINPKTWDKATLAKELSRGLCAVDEARGDFSKSRAMINADSDQEIIDPEIENVTGYGVHGHEHDFLYWLKAGAAFTLPLALLGVVLLILLWTRLVG